MIQSTFGKRLAKLAATAPIRWTILSRAAVAAALLLPTGMRLVDICAACSAADTTRAGDWAGWLCFALSLLEVACAFSYGVGGMTRLFAFPAMAILSLKALSGLLSLWPELSIPGLVACGDWVFAAAHLGALTLVMDLNELGSGLWSIDHLLSVRWSTPNRRPARKDIQ